MRQSDVQLGLGIGTRQQAWPHPARMKSWLASGAYRLLGDGPRVLVANRPAKVAPLEPHPGLVVPPMFRGIEIAGGVNPRHVLICCRRQANAADERMQLLSQLRPLPRRPAG